MELRFHIDRRSVQELAGEADTAADSRLAERHAVDSSAEVAGIVVDRLAVPKK